MVKDARYFKHDANARHDPKIKALIKTYGIEGYGRFWVIIEILRESSHYRLEDESYIWDSLAEELKCTQDEVKKFVSDCCKIFKLFEQDEGFFYSTSLLNRMIQLDQIREKRVAAANTRWGKED